MFLTPVLAGAQTLSSAQIQSTISVYQDIINYLEAQITILQNELLQLIPPVTTNTPTTTVVSTQVGGASPEQPVVLVPSCALSVSTNEAPADGSVVVTWSSQNTDSGVLTNNHDSGYGWYQYGIPLNPVSGGSKNVLLSGELDDGSNIITGTFTGEGTTTTCSTIVYLN